MLIMSWNVAGLSSTVSRIHSNYALDVDNISNTNSTVQTGLIQKRRRRESQQPQPQQVSTVQTSTASNSATTTAATTIADVLSYYFQRHTADIVCLQEHKISKLQLHNHIPPYAQCATLHPSPSKARVVAILPPSTISTASVSVPLASNTNQMNHNTDSSSSSFPMETPPPTPFHHPLHECKDVGYESFWSCCTDVKSKGFNGVVTYVKCHSSSSSSSGKSSSPTHSTLSSSTSSIPQWTTTVISANGVTCFNYKQNVSHGAMEENYNNDNEPLDQQGRCVITEHGPPTTSTANESSSSTSPSPGFILFNVYVPCSTQKNRQQKMKFLTALRHCMQEQRRTRHKPIILVGDLNITHTKYDVHYMNRIVYMNELLRQTPQLQKDDDGTSNVKTIPQWKRDIQTHWSTIIQILQTMQAVPTTTTNSQTGEVYHKFRCRVTITTPTPTLSTVSTNNNSTIEKPSTSSSSAQPVERYIYLGSHETTVDACLSPYTMSSIPFSSSVQDDPLSTTLQSQHDDNENNTPTVRVLVELMNKLILGKQPGSTTTTNTTEWDDVTIRDIADTVGTVSRNSFSRQWLDAIINEDKMIDTFRYYYPQAQGRYTCWNQSTNSRYQNDGARIDYTLMDEALLPYLQKGNVTTLRCGGIDDNIPRDCNASSSSRSEQDATAFAMSEAGAIQAITANGRYQPAPFDGNGIVESSRTVLDTQFGAPHTGHIYTPPTFSDHIGVSLLLDDTVVAPINLNEFRNVNTLLWNDPSTRKSQPHKQQPTIGSFFQNVQRPTSSTTSTGTIISNNTTSTTRKKPPPDEESRSSRTTTEASVVSSSNNNSTNVTKSTTVKRSPNTATSATSSRRSNSTKPSNKCRIAPPLHSVWYHFPTKEKQDDNRR
jgi:exonuclease III